MQGCHRLRGRRAGSTLYLDVNIEVGSPETHAFCYMQNASWTNDLTKSPGFTCQFLFLDRHLLVSFSLQVDPFSSVSSAHDIGENVRRQIHKSHPTVTEMFIHIGLLDGFINFVCDWDRILVICYQSPPPI